jgi:hypothetical protein
MLGVIDVPRQHGQGSDRGPRSSAGSIAPVDNNDRNSEMQRSESAGPSPASAIRLTGRIANRRRSFGGGGIRRAIGAVAVMVAAVAVVGCGSSRPGSGGNALLLDGSGSPGTVASTSVPADASSTDSTGTSLPTDTTSTDSTSTSTPTDTSTTDTTSTFTPNCPPWPSTANLSGVGYALIRLSSDERNAVGSDQVNTDEQVVTTSWAGVGDASHLPLSYQNELLGLQSDTGAGGAGLSPDHLYSDGQLALDLAIRIGDGCP